MQDELELKIEVWINKELKNAMAPMPVEYFTQQASNYGLTSNQVEDVIERSLAQGKLFEPFPGRIARINFFGPTKYPHKKEGAMS